MGDVATRNEKGQFVKGQSGNPVGRPKGIRNQTAIVKDFINNALVNELEEDALAVIRVAIKKAKAGDNAMIKLLLKDLLAAASDDVEDKSDIVVKVKNMTVTQEDITVIEHGEINE